MNADFHISVFQTSRSLPFLCVYSLQFLLTGCGLPLAARVQIEINEAASVFELLSYSHYKLGLLSGVAAALCS